MTPTFDIRRFGQLLWHDVRSCPNQQWTMNLYLAILFPPLMVMFQHFAAGQPHGAAYRLFLIVFMSAIMAMLVPYIIYPNIGKKRRGIYFAMLPATKAEKHLAVVGLSVLTLIGMIVAGLSADLLFTLLHLPGYSKYFWQSSTLQYIDCPMLTGCLLAFIAALFGSIAANTLKSQKLQALCKVVAILWLMASIALFVVEPYGHNAHSIIPISIAVEAVLALVLAWFSRHRMDNMTY